VYETFLRNVVRDNGIVSTHLDRAVVNLQRQAHSKRDWIPPPQRMNEEFECHLNGTIMIHPAYPKLHPEGPRFEYETLEKHATEFETHPFTDEPLETTDIVRDEKMKADIVRFLNLFSGSANDQIKRYGARFPAKKNHSRMPLSYRFPFFLRPNTEG
jgi:hypothetical protein